MSDVKYTDWELILAAQKQASRDYAESLMWKNHQPESEQDLRERSSKMLHLAERLKELTAVRPSTGKAEPPPTWQGEGES